MVYQIFSNGIDRNSELRASLSGRKQQLVTIRAPAGAAAAGAKQRARNSSVFNYFNLLLIILIKSLLFIYDLTTLPVYLLWQLYYKPLISRPRTQQVSANTWIRSAAAAAAQVQQQQRKKQWKFMGSTLSEVFANSVLEFNLRPCLGYRALVTCPIIGQDETGRPMFREQSFRSDFTWYTYGQIGRRVQDIASGLYHYSILPTTSRALFLASSCLEWFCMAQSCFQLAIQLVLLPTSLELTNANQESLKTFWSIVDESRAELLVVTCDQLAKLCKLLDYARRHRAPTQQLGSLSKLIIIDWQFVVDLNDSPFLQLGQVLRQLDEESLDAGANKLQVLSIGQVEEAGIENPIELRCSRALHDVDLHPVVRPPEVATRHTPPTPPTRPSGWLVGGEPVSTSMSEPPLRRRQKRAQRRRTTAASNGHTIGGDNMEQLESELLNAYRNFDSPLDDHHAPPTNCTTATNCRSDHSEWVARAAAPQPKAEDAAAIVYTYGQLGQLKAIVMTHKQLVRGNQEHFLDQLLGVGGTRDVHCATLALDRVVELVVEIGLLSRGASIAYSNNLATLFYDGKELFERDKSDLETANPTFLLVRPYILERLRSSVQVYLQLHLSPVMSFLLKHLVYEYKKFWCRRDFATPLTDRLFCSQLKRLFGTNINFVLCDGMTDCTETKEFFTYLLDLPVIETYGPDEAILSLISLNDRTSRHNSYINKHDHEQEEEVHDFAELKLMPPTHGTDAAATNVVYENFSRNILHSNSALLWPTSDARIKLEDWEEFRLTDLPYPRGQLLVGGDFVSRGHCLTDAHAHAHAHSTLGPLDEAPPFFTDPMGICWFRTGDIARVFPSGSFEIISAISNLIKMVDGQFVSLSQIEHILRNSQFVENVCALCGEQRTFVINLVVPNLRRLALKSPNEANLKMAIGTEPEPEELADVEFRREVCNDRLMCEFLADHLRQMLAKSGLASITNRFLLVPEIWTPDSELVTSAFEPKRDAIRKFYASDIQALIQLEHRTASWRLSANRRRMNLINSNKSPGRRK